MRVNISIDVSDQLDQTTYNIEIEGQPFAAIKSDGKRLAVEFHENTLGLNVSESLYALNAAYNHWDMKQSWSDVEFDLNHETLGAVSALPPMRADETLGQYGRRLQGVE